MGISPKEIYSYVYVGYAFVSWSLQPKLKNLFVKRSRSTINLFGEVRLSPALLSHKV